MVLIQLLFCLSFFAPVFSVLFQAALKSAQGQVLIHDRPFSVFPVPNSGLCAVECERRGKAECKAFNVKQNSVGMSCELFHDRSYKLSDLQTWNATNERYFGMMCDGVSLRSGVKDVSIDGQVIVTLIDVDQKVYQQRSNGTLQFLGSVSAVFDGMDDEAMDITSTYVTPLGRVHLIRSGQLVHCFIADEGWRKFSKCISPFFPISIKSLLPTFRPIIYMIAYDIYKLVELVLIGDLKSIIVSTNAEKGLESGELSVKISNQTEMVFNCKYAEQYVNHYKICPWEELWMKAAGGVFLSRTRFCLFTQTTCYIYDFDFESIVERHPICKDEINDFLL